MKKKSKFLTFLLSFIPGLGHIYLGFTTRGLIFLSVLLGDIFLTSLLVNFVNHDLLLLTFIIPIIWLVALVDSIMLVDKIRAYNTTYDSQSQLDSDFKNEVELFSTTDKPNKKILTMVLSIIPGAGHMYLGHQNQGLQLMGLFFFTIFFTDWLRISFLMAILPLVWFYSMFDALNKLTEEHKVHDDNIILFTYLKDNHKLIGYFLILMGVLLILERILVPTFDIITGFNVSQYIHSLLVSLVFIWGGIKLIKNNINITNEFKEDDE